MPVDEPVQDMPVSPGRQYKSEVFKKEEKAQRSLDNRIASGIIPNDKEYEVRPVVGGFQIHEVAAGQQGHDVGEKQHQEKEEMSFPEVMQGLEGVIPRESQRPKDDSQEAEDAAWERAVAATKGGLFKAGWFRPAGIAAFDEKHGTSYAGKVKAYDVMSTLRSHIKGRELTGRQQAAWSFIKDYAEKEYGAIYSNLPGADAVTAPSVTAQPAAENKTPDASTFATAKESTLFGVVSETAPAAIKAQQSQPGESAIKKQYDLIPDAPHVAEGMDNPDNALDHFENAIPQEDRAAMAEVFAYIRKNSLHRQTSFAQQLFNMVGGMYEKRTGKKLAILGGNADNITREATNEQTTAGRAEEGGSSDQENGAEGLTAGTRASVPGDDEQAGAGPAGTITQSDKGTAERVSREGTALAEKVSAAMIGGASIRFEYLQYDRAFFSPMGGVWSGKESTISITSFDEAALLGELHKKAAQYGINVGDYYGRNDGSAKDRVQEESGPFSGNAGLSGVEENRRDGGGPAAQEERPGSVPAAQAVTPPAVSSQFSIEPLREKSILVKGDPKEIVAKLKDAGVKANGIPNTGRGGMVYAKKHEAKIRAALEASVSKTAKNETLAGLSLKSDTQKEITHAKTDTVDPSSHISQASKPADLIIKSLETGKETVLTVEKQEENSAKAKNDDWWAERDKTIGSLGDVGTKVQRKDGTGPEVMTIKHINSIGHVLVEGPGIPAGELYRPPALFKRAEENNTSATSAKDQANTIFTEDMYQAARERMRARLNRPNAGLDPEMVQDGIIMAGFHIESGARTFTAYAKAMVADMGDMVKPYLKSWYMAAKFDPRLSATEGLSGAADVESADIDKIVAEENKKQAPEKKDDTVTLESFTAQLERKGVATDATGTTYSIQAIRPGQYYIRWEKDGIRQEHGPGYPVSWGIEKAREQAIGRAKFSENDSVSPPNEKIDKDAASADNIDKGIAIQPKGEGNEHRGTAKQSQEALDEVVSEDGTGPQGDERLRQGDAGGSETGTAPDRPVDESGVSAPRSGRSRASRGNSNPTGKTGRGRRGVAREAGSPDALTETPNIPAVNFAITEDVRLGKGGESEKFRDNISAIETLKKIELEASRATPEEQKTLARYVGWGGLANAFANPIDGKIKAGWEDRVKQLADLLDEKEIAAARNSTQNAHYTAPAVVSAMWDAMRQLGVKGGIGLEPSVGAGNFIGMAPKDMAGVKFVGVEYDSITARLAKALYPQASIIHSGFQKVPVPAGAFDLVIGNPPFGKESLTFRHNPAISRFSIHNQFFLAGIDALKPGGIQAMVVSRYLLDAKDSSARLALARKADLLGAIRLPDTAFKENARTEVVTDIIFLQKHFYDHDAKRFDAHGEEMPPIKFEAPEWVETSSIPDPLGGEPMTVNNYFARNPKAIIGTMERSGSMQHGADITVRLDKGNDLAALLGQKIKDILPENVVTHTLAQETIAKRFEDMRVGLEIAMAGHEPGNVSINAEGKLEHITEKENAQGDWEMTRRVITPESPWSPQLSMNADGKWFREIVKLDEKGNKVKSGRLNVYTREVFASDKEVPAALHLGQAKYDRLVELVKIRDLLKEQINLEINDRAEAKIEGNRKALKAAYDAFVKGNGFISDGKNSSLVSEMPDGALVLSLENSYKKAINPIQAKRTNSSPRKASAKQAAILSSRVVFKQKPMEKAESPGDAILISLSESGTVDMERIAQLLGISEEEAVAKLHDELENPLIFHNPETGGWEQADEYLTGQVVKKMAAAKAAGLTKNARALEKVIPEQWGPDKVTPVIGASWVPAEDYSDFVAHLTGVPAKVRYSKIANSYSVTGNGKAAGGIQWRTEHADAIFLVNALLNSSSVNIYYTDSAGKRHLNQEASELAAMKASEIESEFTDWAFADSDRRNRLVQKFNDKFNARVPRQRDGSHMTLPGKVPDLFIKMHRHQMNAIWRGVVDRFTLYDHAVGAGKTFTAIARAMERKRMGVSRKPMIVVPNHLVEQFAADVYRLYPGANLLAASKKDFEKKSRRRLFAKIATGNWDIVIVPHSSFKAIGISQEAEERFLEQDLKA
ncbi:MAG: hypothetical protein OEV91_02600, partial [Desulfobulbaceae bacterium]|nr:hypothetical protein [Desulfobulbaceae bacterium]